MDTLKKSAMSRILIVVIAAALVALISIVQYQGVRSMMAEEMNMRSRVIGEAKVHEIAHTLELTQLTMRENIMQVQRSMAHPDSVFQAMVYLIDDNPHVVGGCLAFVPDYYPSKGHLFEPYAHKENGTIVVSQIAGPDHDYTQNVEFQEVIETEEPLWTDPYFYGPDSLSFTTYSYPVYDSKGRLAAVCGLDMDLSWIGDTLNAHHHFKSSFGLLLTREGDLVAKPSESQVPAAVVEQALAIYKGILPPSANRSIAFRSSELKTDPYWEVVQVYRVDEVFARMRRMRWQHFLLILLAMGILGFMIHYYMRNEKRLRQASEEQARMSGELAVARNIQLELLPKTFPPSVYGSVEPAREIGGDVFDFFTRDGKLFFCIGDVSGKGVPSALLMSMVRSLFRMVAQKDEDPSHILQAINNELCRGNDSNMFITFFVGCLDLYTGVLHIGNAGHDKPFMLTDKIELLPTKSNLPLGVFPNTRFEAQRFTFAPGTTLVLYTDGLTEAKNMERKQFGRDGVVEVLQRFVGVEHPVPEQIVSSLSEAAHTFAGEAQQSDDLTLLVVHYAPDNLPRQEITLVNDVADVSRLSTFVKDYCAQLDIDKKTVSGMRLGLEEAVVNVMNYAYLPGDEGSFTVYADSNRKEIRFTIVDSGMPFDPTSVLDADVTLDAQNRPIGGLGILITRKLMDSISYSRQNGKNVLTLTKSIS